MFTATRTQAATYLLGVCLFSISFLVFLNSSISFVVTDLLNQRHDVGNAVVSTPYILEQSYSIQVPHLH